MKSIPLVLSLVLLAGCVGLSPDPLESRPDGLPKDGGDGPPDHEWTLSDDTVLLFTNRTEEEGRFSVHHRAEAQNSEDPWTSAVNRVGSIMNTRGYTGYSYWSIQTMGHRIDLPDLDPPTRGDERKLDERVLIGTGPQYFVLHSSGSNSQFSIPGDVNVTEIARDHNMFYTMHTSWDEGWDHDAYYRAPLLKTNIGSITVPLVNDWGLAVIRVSGQYFNVEVEPTGCIMEGVADQAEFMFATSETDMEIHFEQVGRGASGVNLMVFDLPVTVDRPECQVGV